MKVILFGDNKALIENLVREAGFEIVGINPDYIVCFGGDGTLMRAETEFPNIPKVLLRDSAICKKCSVFSNEEVLKRVKEGAYTIEKLPKIEARAKGIILHATNDIIVHNKNPRHGIRYSIFINEKPLGPLGREIIGDGIIVATPFGSTAYYRSITDSYFEVGMGIAFNNSTEPSDHIVLKDDSIITLKVIRGPAEVFADNDPKEIELNEGEYVEIKRSEEFAQIVCPY